MSYDGRMLRSFVLTLAATATACACADRPPASPAGTYAAPSSGPATSIERPGISPACGQAAAPAGVFPKKVPIFGKERSYTLFVPPGYVPGTSHALVFVLHGHGGNGAQIRSSFDLESVANGKAIFVYPDGLGGGWDLDSPAEKNADVALFDAALALTQGSYCVDLRRVFVTGFSNGAYMANQLGCRRGDRIRGVASHAGGGPYETAGSYDAEGNLVCSGKAVASLVVHGSADGTVAPSEGQKSTDHWAHANHCGGPGGHAPAGCSAPSNCTNAVMTCKVPGLGHSLWPRARTVTWSFFESL